MADHNLIDDPLVSFDQQSPSTTTKVVKTNDSYENRLLDDIDPFGSHNGEDNHHNGTNGNQNLNTQEFSLNNDLFPVDPQEKETDRLHEFSTRENEELNASPWNGGVSNKNTLLLDFDPEAPPPVKSTNSETPSPNDFHQQQAHAETLQDFDSVPVDTHQQDKDQADNAVPDSKSADTEENPPLVAQSDEQEHQLLSQAYDEVDHAAQELATKLDLVSSPPATPDRQPAPPAFDTQQVSTEEKPTKTPSPAKKPAASAAKPTSATKPKPSTTPAASAKSTEAKSTATATSKSTEAKAAASATKPAETKPAVRKTIHSAPSSGATAAAKPKPTPTSPSQDAPKPTRDAPAKSSTATATAAKPKPTPSSTATSTTGTAASRTTVRPVPKPTRPSTVPKPSDSASAQQTTILSTAPEGAAAAPRASAKPPQQSTKPPTKTASGSTTATSTRVSASTTKPTVPRERPSSQTRATASRPSTTASASATAAPKRSNSASRPSTADAASRTARSGPTDTASGTTATTAKPQWNNTSSRIGSLQNTTHKPGGGAVKKLTVTRSNPISSQKLQWNAKSKIGSLDNAAHKPGGGAVKIESKKLDFKEKAKPRTDSGKQETMTSGGGDSASATVDDEHHPKEPESNEDAPESPNKE